MSRRAPAQRAATVLAALVLVGCGASGAPDLSTEVDLRLRSRHAAASPVDGGPATTSPAATSQTCLAIFGNVDALPLKLATEEPPAMFLPELDRCMAQAGRAAELVALYRAVVEQRPRDARYRHGLANAFVAVGDAPEALRQVGHALELDPDHPDSLYLKGLLLGTQAQSGGPPVVRAARDAWRRLLEVDGSYVGLGDVGPGVIGKRVAEWTAALGEVAAAPPAGQAPPVPAPIEVKAP